jgi:hypothetical protein
MAHGRVPNAEAVEEGEQIVGAGRHGREVALGKMELSAAINDTYMSVGR